jgi:hypothetical protein
MEFAFRKWLILKDAILVVSGYLAEISGWAATPASSEGDRIVVDELETSKTPHANPRVWGTQNLTFGSTPGHPSLAIGVVGARLGSNHAFLHKVFPVGEGCGGQKERREEGRKRGDASVPDWNGRDERGRGVRVTERDRKRKRGTMYRAPTGGSE